MELENNLKILEGVNLYKKVILVLILSFFLVGCNLNESNDLVFTGTIEGEEIDISTEIGGILKEIFIEEGDKIEEGKSIALIDTRDLELKLKKAQEALSLSNAKLQDTLKGDRNEEINNLKANLDRIDTLIEGANKNYKYRLNNYNRIKELYENKASSEQDLNDAKSLLDAEETNLESLRKQYDGVEAQLNLLLKGATLETIKMLEAEVKIAEAEINIIKNEIEKGKITAPINGIIQNINYKENELIPLGGKITTIIDDAELFVNIYIPEKQLHLIKLNDRVRLVSEHMKNRVLEGKIIYISPEAEFTPKNIESKENKQEMVFKVKIKILKKDVFLKPGMLIDVVLDGEDNE